MAAAADDGRPRRGFEVQSPYSPDDAVMCANSLRQAIAVLLVGIIQVWFVGDAVEALTLRDQSTAEGASSPDTGLIFVDKLSKKMNCMAVVEPHRRVADNHLRFLQEHASVPLERIPLKFEQNGHAWTEGDFAQLAARLDAPVQKKALHFGDHFNFHHTSDDRACCFPDIGQMKIDADRLALQDAPDNRFSQNDPGPVSGISGKPDRFLGGFKLPIGDNFSLFTLQPAFRPQFVGGSFKGESEPRDKAGGDRRDERPISIKIVDYQTLAKIIL